MMPKDKIQGERKEKMLSAFWLTQKLSSQSEKDERHLEKDEIGRTAVAKQRRTQAELMYRLGHEQC